MEETCLSRLGSGVWLSLRDGDFEEQEIWDVIRDAKSSNTMIARSKEFPVPVPRRLPTSSKMIPKTSSDDYSYEAKIMQQSAPVHIPNWPKAYGQNTKRGSENRPWHNERGDSNDEEVVERDDEDVYNAKEPPHVFLSRRLARSQISSFSVFEGAGRTLKGRDLNKMRNDVLSRTGFLESL